MDRRCELLAPAGDREALVAAVQNGADAVYLGGQVLNARRNAGNFDDQSLSDAVSYCHERGVRVYVTVNIMLKERERETLDSVFAQIARAGADAAIVSDLGVAAYAKKALPSLDLHLSTQAAILNACGVRVAAQLGFTRVVLAREMGLSEIREAARQGIEVEVFAHGALCTSVSGQCLFSSLVGGRSGNRGLCAQPCRLPYSFPGDEPGYLLSLKDLCLIDRVGELADAGVTGLKIEGRMRRPEYVAIATRAYRLALDAHFGGDAVNTGALREELLQIYNRGGFTEGYAMGAKARDLIYPERPNHFGVCVGTSDINGLTFTRDLNLQDQLVLRAPRKEDVPVRLSGKPGAIHKISCPPGTSIIRLTSDEQMKRARESYGGEVRQGHVSGAAVFRVGEPGRLMVSDEADAVEFFGGIVERAQHGVFSSERAERQLRKSGDSPLRINELTICADEDAYLSVGEMNALRRGALNEFTERKRLRLRGCEADLAPTAERPRIMHPWPDKPTLCARASSFAQLTSAASAGAEELHFLPIELSEDALQSLRPKAQFALELPPTATYADLIALNHWANDNTTLIFATVCQNPSHFAFTWPGEIRAGFCLNIANREAVYAYADLGAKGYVPSVELTCTEIEDMDAPIERELIVYGRLPLMQLRHCPNHAARASDPSCSSCQNCKGCPPLVDRRSCAFPLATTRGSEGCVLTVLNSVPLSLHRRWKLPPCDRATMFFTDEGPSRVKALTALYRGLIDGEAIKMPEAEDFASTTGHYFRGVD